MPFPDLEQLSKPVCR